MSIKLNSEESFENTKSDDGTTLVDNCETKDQEAIDDDRDTESKLPITGEEGLTT